MQSTLQQSRIAELLVNPDMLATPLMAMLIDHYGVECLQWDFATIRMELKDDFQATLPEVNEQKIQALITAMTTDGFFRDPMIFHHVAKALTNEPVDFEQNVPLEPDEAAWAAFEVISMDGKNHPQFSDEVKRYVGVSLKHHGLHHKPRTLGFAMMEEEGPSKDTSFPADAHNPDDQSSFAPGSVLADDAQLYAGSYRRSREDATEIDNYVQQRFNTLMDQLKSLPLTHRNADSWEALVKKLSKN